MLMKDVGGGHSVTEIEGMADTTKKWKYMIGNITI